MFVVYLLDVLGRGETVEERGMGGGEIVRSVLVVRDGMSGRAVVVVSEFVSSYRMGELMLWLREAHAYERGGEQGISSGLRR